MLVHKSKLSAYTVYLIYSGTTSLSFSLIFTVNLVYQVEAARLNPLQLVLVGTVLYVLHLSARYRQVCLLIFIAVAQQSCSVFYCLVWHL